MKAIALYSIPDGFAVITDEKVPGHPSMKHGFGPMKTGDPNSVVEQVWHPDRMKDWKKISLSRLPDRWRKSLKIRESKERTRVPRDTVLAKPVGRKRKACAGTLPNAKQQAVYLPVLALVALACLLLALSKLLFVFGAVCFSCGWFFSKQVNHPTSND